MADSGLERFLGVIAYPDRAGLEAGRVVLQIDENEVIATEIGGYIRWTTRLDIGSDELAELAGFVPGRIYRDAATLAVDGDGNAFLWQEAAARAEENELRSAFEAFLAAVDWWRERVEASRTTLQSSFGDGMIRP